jgi:HEAT repeat protein
VRLRAVEMLKDAAYPEGAVPLAAAVLDPDDNVQLEAIAAELNTFLAEKVLAKKRVGLIVEVRNKIVAESAFSAGPFVLGADPVPLDVLTALRRAVHDDNPRVGLEALYAFGTLAGEAGGAERRELLRQAAPDLAPIPGALDESLQIAALRVIERVFAVRPLDPPIDLALGDTVVAALNDKHKEVRLAAIETLGRIRYPRAVQALADLEQFYGRGEIAEGALDALARIAQPGSRPLFSSGLSSKSPAMKKAAIEGLVRLGDRSAIEAVQSALAGERDQAVLSAARFSSVILSGGSVDPIVQDLTRDSRHDQAFEYIVEIERARPRSFSAAAQNRDPRVRRDIANALGFAADGSALLVLEPMAQDPDRDVALAAKRAAMRVRAAMKVS